MCKSYLIDTDSLIKNDVISILFSHRVQKVRLTSNKFNKVLSKDIPTIAEN